MVINDCVNYSVIPIFDFAGCIGLFCPCFLFAKNAEFLGSGTLMGSCTIHFILWALVNTVCCLVTDGVLLGLPGCFVAFYACGYRRAIRSRYNLQVRHFHCLLPRICLMIEKNSSSLLLSSCPLKKVMLPTQDIDPVMDNIERH